jgi:hypothetical protein
LSKDFDEKIAADVRRLASTTDPDRLIYCSSQKITEHKIDELQASIRAYMHPRCSILVLGAVQLANLAERFGETFEKHYRAELRTIEANLLSFQGPEEKTETKGLRLALIAFRSDDARLLRRVISRRAILETLRLLQKGDVAVLAGKLSDDLRLPRPVEAHFIHSILTQMRSEGAVTEQGGQWCLTEKGRQEAESVPPDAAQELLAGRTVIRKRLEELTGIVPTESQFGTIWSTLLDFLAELFYSNGLALIKAIDELLSAAPPSPELPPNLEKLLESGANKVKAVVSVPALAEEIEQAILDMFTERSGPAFEWLARVCERFVALCALGLESASADEVRRVVLRNEIVLDSDIVLTVLCEGEKDHRAARELIGRWRRIGGKFLLALPVLEEVAYHAWISERDFEETRLLLGTLGEDELHRYVENAFVRAFYSLAKTASEVKKWPIYIRQFKGVADIDYSNLLNSLQADLGAEILPAGYDEALRKEILEFLRTSIARSKGIEVRDLDQDDLIKSERDGRLLASVAAARATLRQLGKDHTVVLLSSSVRLRRVDVRFRSSLGVPPAVISLGAFSFLLSMLPGVELGAGTLRRALFEFGTTGHLPDTERLALRVIRAHADFDVPWARRRTLQAELGRGILSEASKLDEDPRTLRKRFASADQSVRPAEIILNALRNMAANDAKSQELEKAQRKIRILESQVDELQQRLITRFKEARPSRGTR